MVDCRRRAVFRDGYGVKVFALLEEVSLHAVVFVPFQLFDFAVEGLELVALVRQDLRGAVVAKGREVGRGVALQATGRLTEGLAGEGVLRRFGLLCKVGERLLRLAPLW